MVAFSKGSLLNQIQFFPLFLASGVIYIFQIGGKTKCSHPYLGNAAGNGHTGQLGVTAKCCFSNAGNGIWNYYCVTPWHAISLPYSIVKSFSAAKAGTARLSPRTKASARDNNFFFIWFSSSQIKFPTKPRREGGGRAPALGSVGNIKSGVERITQHRLTEIQSKRNTKPISCCKLGDMTV